MKKRLLFCWLVIFSFLFINISSIAETNLKTDFDVEFDCNNFSEQSALRKYDDGSWIYVARCDPYDREALYSISLDIHCWGEEKLTIYPQMTVMVFREEDYESIQVSKLSIQVANNIYEYNLYGSHPPWTDDILAGITFLFPSDQQLLEDCASVKEFKLIAETEAGTMLWLVSGEDYEKDFLPCILDMVRFDFLNNVEKNERSDNQLSHENGLLSRTIHKNVGSELAFYNSGPEPEEGYSFSEDPVAIKDAAKSVFYVEMYDEEKNCLGNASGFVAFEDHYFVTNEHIVDGASYLIIWDENDKSYVLDQVVAIDKDHDIAILEFEEGSQYTSLWLDANNDLKRGMPIVVIGSRGLQVASSIGIIGALRVLEQYAGAKCIQYSALTSLESNGGCLFGNNGKVIGIASAISNEGQYIGVAVPTQFLLDLYSKLKSNAYNVMDSKGSNHSGILEENGKKKEDPTIITGGKINTIVAISDELDLDPFIMDTMDMTANDFLDAYDEVRRTLVKNAPQIVDRTLKEYYGGYYLQADPEAGVGLILNCDADKEIELNNLDIPLSYVQLLNNPFYKGKPVNVTANVRACLAVFTKDAHFMDKILDFYSKNDCRHNDQYAGVLTSEGYLIVYFENLLGDKIFNIYDVSP